MNAFKKLGLYVALPVVGILMTFSGAGAQDPCENCGPGDHWIDSCNQTPLYDEIIEQEVLAGIALTSDGPPIINLRMGPTDDPPCYGSQLFIERSAPVVSPDSHYILTVLSDLCVKDDEDDVVLWVGHQNGLDSSKGIIKELADPALALSSFDIFFAVDVPGYGTLYNHDPIHIEDTITCVPPKADYIHLGGGIPLFDAPPGMGGTVQVYLVDAVHRTFPGDIPTLSEWGLIIFCALLFGWMAWMIVRRRRTTMVNG